MKNSSFIVLTRLSFVNKNPCTLFVVWIHSSCVFSFRFYCTSSIKFVSLIWTLWDHLSLTFSWLIISDWTSGVIHHPDFISLSNLSSGTSLNVSSNLGESFLNCDYYVTLYFWLAHSCGPSHQMLFTLMPSTSCCFPAWLCLHYGYSLYSGGNDFTSIPITMHIVCLCPVSQISQAAL